jgi:hypothetical protein
MGTKVWIGIDAGKVLHWAHVLDAAGQQILSRSVRNDEADLWGLIDEVLALAEEAVWAIDQPGGQRGGAASGAVVGARAKGPLPPRIGRRSGSRRLPRAVQDRSP